MSYTKINKYIIVACVLVMMLIAQSYAASAKKTKGYEADVFPITFWAVDYLVTYPKLYKIALTDKEYARYKDCNFNLIMGGSPELARKYHMKYINTSLREKKFLPLWYRPFDKPVAPKYIKMIKDAVRAVDKTNPALWGYHLADEPGRGNVLHARLASYFKAIRSVDSKHKIFVNMLPGYRPEPYAEDVNPDVLAYDQYPIFGDDDSYVSVNGKKQPSGGANGRYDTCSILYLLAMYRKAAAKYNKLFIPTLLSIGHRIEYKNAQGGITCRNFGHITDAKLRWQAYSALAYNADGIAWYRYYSYPGPNSKYHPAAIDLNWEKTKIYPWLKQLNAEVFAIGKILKGLKSKAVYETKPVYLWRKKYEKELTFFPANDIIKKVYNGLTTVGVFTGKKSKVYLLIVNRNIKKAIEAGLSMRWRSIKSIVMYDKRNLKWGKTIWKKGDAKRLNVALAPGDAAFLKVKLLK